MLELKRNAMYERAELVEAFPHIDFRTLTRFMVARGAKRLFPRSRKLFILGDAIIDYLSAPQTGEPLPAVDSGTAGSQSHLHDLKPTTVQRQRVRDVA